MKKEVKAEDYIISVTWFILEKSFQPLLLVGDARLKVVVMAMRLKVKPVTLSGKTDLVNLPLCYF